MTQGNRAAVADARGFTVWEGVYPTYEQALLSAGGDGFSADIWVERARRRLQEIMRDPQETLLATQSYLLPVAAALLARDDRPLRVLDFGGGPGTGFLSLVAAEGVPAGFEYHIVENPKIVALAREMFGDDARLCLHDRLPTPFPTDIAHLGSCIQYIDDLDGLLAGLTAFEPRVLLFSDVFVGDIEGFWTLQNLWGSRVPFRFLRERDFIEAVTRNGFRLRLRVPYIATILGQSGALPMDNFPPDRRIVRAGHYLFMAG